MLDATKVKPQRVAVLEVLRPEGVLLLTKYSAKIPFCSVYGISLPLLDLYRL